MSKVKGQKVWESGFRVQGSTVEIKSLWGLREFIELPKVERELSLC